MVLLRMATGDIIFGAFETKEAARALTLTACSKLMIHAVLEVRPLAEVDMMTLRHTTMCCVAQGMQLHLSLPTNNV